MQKLLYIFSTIIFLFSFNIAVAKEIKIIAKVGNKIITNYDIEQRLNIFLLSNKNILKEYSKNNLKKQIREILITENLQITEAENNNISITEEELEQNLLNVANRAELFLNDFIDLLKKNNISLNSFKEQIKANLYWQKLVLYKIRPQITISDFEINNYITKINKSNGYKYKTKIAKFPITNKKNSKAFIEQIYKNLNQKKVSFANIYKEFPSSRIEKDNDWKILSDFEPSLRREINLLSKNSISAPIKIEDFYYIIFLEDKTLSLKDKSIDKNKIYQRLFIEKLSIKAENYLKNLKNKYKLILS